MANVSRIKGFRPAKSLVGGAWTSLVRQYPADAAKSLSIFIGDVVTLAADGQVEAAATGDVVLGVAVAAGTNSGTTFGETGYFNPNDLGKRFLAAADDGVIGVVPAEMCLFQAFVTAGLDADLALGDSVDFVAGAGSAITGNSAHTIGSTTVNSDVKVVEFMTAPDNDSAEADAQYIVKFNLTENAIN